jgi:hypothetical protein
MNIKASICSALLIGISAAGVAACEQVPNTPIARSVEAGPRVENSRVPTSRDRARFDCVASSSGPCQVVVFVSECPGAACSTRLIKQFAVPVGEAADMVKLPLHFQYCLAHGRRPVAPACLNG